jgi:hypothetical protein
MSFDEQTERLKGTRNKIGIFNNTVTQIDKVIYKISWKKLRNTLAIAFCIAFMIVILYYFHKWTS